MEINSAFSRRLLVDWLQIYCNDSKRNYLFENFEPKDKIVTRQDTRDFIGSLDDKILSDVGGGRFRMPQS